MVIVCGDFSTEDGKWHELPYAECRKCSSCNYQARLVKRETGKPPTFACAECFKQKDLK